MIDPYLFIYINSYDYFCTAGPWLSESPLFEPSIILMLFLFWNPKTKFDFLQNQVINRMLVWFLDMLGLLYHSTVDRKSILEDAIVSASHTID